MVDVPRHGDVRQARTFYIGVHQEIAGIGAFPEAEVALESSVISKFQACLIEAMKVLLRERGDDARVVVLRASSLPNGACPRTNLPKSS